MLQADSTEIPRATPIHRTWTRKACLAIGSLGVIASCALTLEAPAVANPDDPPVVPMPEVIVTPTNWAPKVRLPYDNISNHVAPADITAMGEMCQWFNAQYRDLVREIDQFGFNLLHASNDWTVGQIQAQADAVAANIDQAENFLAPRAQALTQTQDFAGDQYFPVYQGEAFYRLWQQLSNVGVGIKARNTAWVNGPASERVKHWGSKIHRSHACD
jgi:hypothetical protein